jgi:hypothetical protein
MNTDKIMKRHIKTHAQITVLVFVLFGFFGCSRSEIIQEPEASKMREVASHPKGRIYTVEIDGAEYIVVLGDYKAAITPKSGQPLVE